MFVSVYSLGAQVQKSAKSFSELILYKFLFAFLFTSIIKNMVTVNCFEPSTVQWFALNFRSVYKTAYGKHWHSRNTGRIFTRSQVNLFELCLYKSIFMPYVVTFWQKNTYLHVWDFRYSTNLFSIFFLVKHLALLVIDINVNINPLGRTSFWLCVTGIHRVR